MVSLLIGLVCEKLRKKWGFGIVVYGSLLINLVCEKLRKKWGFGIVV